MMHSEDKSKLWSNEPDDEWNYNLRCAKCHILKRIHHSKQETDLYIDSKALPSWLELNKIVSDIEKNSDWLTTYGMEWASLLLSIPLFVFGWYFVGFSNLLIKITGFIMAGSCHMFWSNRIGHLGLHNAMSKSKVVNKVIVLVTQEFISGYCMDLSYEAHIQEHHPYTNVIGIGDSSSFKAPFLPKYIYLYIAPLFLTILAPLASIFELLNKRRIITLLRFILCFSIGTYLFTMSTCYLTNVNTMTSVILVFAARSVMTIPYIHLNVFQHIGLPMWSNEKKPARIYQMTASCINLSSNMLMNAVFGPTLITCHIEHHLFPRLSDSLCLKIRPAVKEFVKKAGLPYNETSYWERLSTFHERYDELMVHAPPVTNFIGL